MHFVTLSNDSITEKIQFKVKGAFKHHPCTFAYVLIIEEGWKQKANQRSSRQFGGQILFNSLPH